MRHPSHIIILYVFLLLCLIAGLDMQAQVRLQKAAHVATLTVDGKPMLILGGELSNSAATSETDIKNVMPRMKAVGLNTVLVPAQWDLIEPEEGHFNFQTIDATLREARANSLNVIFLWFGAWKNSMSCYAPLWFKRDTRRFPRAMTAQGKPLEIASAFSANVLQADKHAFIQLISHLRDVDAKENTCIMVQVENEIGMLESARDHAPAAENSYHQPVPTALINYLRQHAADLHPRLLQMLGGEARVKTLKAGPSWAQVFGQDVYGDEVFMAYHYASYVEQLAKAARAVYDLPLYVNAAMDSRNRQPGEYPSAGPLAHLKDIWHAAATSIDLLAPDLYDQGFKYWVAKYAMPDNPLFIPESRLEANSGVRALYCFGEYGAVGFSTFAIDQSDERQSHRLTQAYQLLDQLSPILLRQRGKGSIHGLLFSQTDKERILQDGDLVMRCRHYFTLPWDSRATDGSAWPEGGGIVLRMAPDEYLIAGSGVVVEFKTQSEMRQEEDKSLGEDGFMDAGKNSKAQAQAKHFEGKRIGIGYVDEVKVNRDGSLQYLRRLNGDQDHQGRHVRIGIDDFSILHVKLYNY